MKRILELMRAVLTMGKENQSFLGAGWMVWALRIAPRALQRKLALWMLSLSPHYFYREFRPEYKSLPLGKFLEAEFARNTSTREMICNQLLTRFIKPTDVIMDVGCGAGFLAKAVARHARTVYACDISQGVLECARIINAADNIQYIHSGEDGFAQIEDSSLDAVYSIAVIQHVREPVIEYLFGIVGKKLRSGGWCLLQVQLEGGEWKKESEQLQDRTLTGRLRMKYGLNFFPRTKVFFEELASKSGMALMETRNVSEYLAEPFDDIYHQELLILEKTKIPPNVICYAEA